jgi:hypothetical protein
LWRQAPQQVGLQIGTGRDFEDLEQRQKRSMVAVGMLLATEIQQLVEQVFEPQQRSNALAERIFV